MRWLHDEISVSDDKSESGMSGEITEFKAYKFGQISYTVATECSDKAKAMCQDVEVIQRYRQFLKLIAAQPPQ